MQSLAPIAATLVTRFRRQRPLRAGSLIVTLFGDSIMPRGGAISLGSLIRLAAPFGLNERLVRTAAARLAAEGWLEARRVGKLSEYQLSGSGRERFLEATQRIYGEPAPWSGRWTLIVLPATPAAERHRLRKELTWRGFGELSPGIFAHPEPSAARRRGTLGRRAPGRPPMRAIAGDRPAPGTLILEAALEEPAACAQLVDRGWDLEELAQGYRRFARRFLGVSAAVRARRIDPESGFIVRTLLIHEYRRLHLRDPLLPTRLLPADWPGNAAARLCREIYGGVLATSESYLSATAVRLQGALPPPGASLSRRFGGVA